MTCFEYQLLQLIWWVNAILYETISNWGHKIQQRITLELVPVVQNKQRMLIMVTPAGQDTYHIAHVLVIWMTVLLVTPHHSF